MSTKHIIREDNDPLIIMVDMLSFSVSPGPVIM